MKINSLSMIFEGEAMTILSAVGGNPSLMCFILVMSLGHLLKETLKSRQLISCTAITSGTVSPVSLAAAVSGHGTVSPVDKNVFEMYRKLLTHTLTVQSIPADSNE